MLLDELFYTVEGSLILSVALIYTLLPRQTLTVSIRTACIFCYICCLLPVIRWASQVKKGFDALFFFLFSLHSPYSLCLFCYSLSLF